MNYDHFSKVTLGINKILYNIIENYVNSTSITAFRIRTLLYKAVELRNLKAVKKLLKQGIKDCNSKVFSDIDYSIIDSHGVSPLHVISMPPNFSFIDTDIWKYHSYVELNEVNNRLQKSKDSYGFQRVELLRIIMEHCTDNDIGKCLTLINIDSIDKTDEIEIIDLLIEKGIDINIKDDLGNTALHYACDYVKGLNIVKKLLSYGADTNIENDLGTTPLACAVNTSNEILVNILLDNNADPNSSSSNILGTKVLHTAVGSGNVDIVGALLMAGANPNVGDKAGVTPLHVATADKNSYLLMEMLLDNGADPNIKCANGFTPLFNAVYDHNRIKLLFLYGADINITDSYGNTPLTYLTNFDNKYVNAIIILQIYLLKKEYNDEKMFPPGMIKNLNFIESNDSLKVIAKKCNSLIRYKKNKDIDADNVLLELLEEEDEIDRWHTTCKIS
ncbi:ankyrin repeat protein [Fowlpox virus]|nr:ankyrin repeat protein [Fowlpox virus]